MTKNKVFAFIVLSLFAVGCTSAGNKKPTVFADKPNNIPADTPSQFDSRYERFISDKEMKAFRKLQTDEERQAFQDKFWAERDFDPSTSENEYKQEIDEKIDDIANEFFLSTPGVFGLSFRSNGGFRGDMAHVYLLHGEPDAMDTIEGDLFVDLMLWVYVDQQNGGVLYAFLFYQKGSIGTYSLFSQDIYKLDSCGAINEVKKGPKEFIVGGNQGCPPNVEEIFQEIYNANGKGGILDGRIFAWAMFNFSQDGSNTQGRALSVPKSAPEIAKQSQARVTGEAPKLVGTAGIDYILASCEQCNSLIPAELQLGKEFTLLIRRGDVDWRITGNWAEVEYKVRLVLENTTTNVPLVFEPLVSILAQKDLVVTYASVQDVVTLLTAKDVDKIPAGTYRVSVYVKNVTSGLMTKKYNAWSREFTK